MKVYSTACPRNCYSTCSFNVHVEEGKIKYIEPHPGNLATPEGPCLKGISYPERVYSEDRILYPLLKNSRNGKFVRITWQEALDILTHKLLEFKAQYGPQSILFYKASGMSGLINTVACNFWEMFGGCTLTYGDLCWPAGLEATRLTLGENKHNVPWELENARLIILWGKNPAETNVQEMVFIENAIERGAKVVVVDPRRTTTADKAELLLQPRPGTDGALALGIARILIAEGNTDSSFIAQHVLGFEQFSRSVEKYTPARVEEITGVPPFFLKKLADYIGTIKPMTIVPGYGFQRYINGGQTSRCILALQVITGNIGKPGACWQYANLQSYVFDQVHEPVSLYPPKQPGGVFRKAVSVARLGEDMMSLKDPELKMIWVERGNPVTQNPDTQSILRAFRNLEFRLVIDQFLTDTAREANLLLPAKSMFEQSDIIGSYWNPYVQLKQKMIEPPGEVKPESELYYLLARELGMAPETAGKKIPEPGDRSVEQWLEEQLKPFPELTLDRLKEGPVLAPGLETIAFQDLKFSTPSGKIELFSDQALELWKVDPLPGYTDPSDKKDFRKEETDYPFYLIAPNTKNRIHSQFGNLKILRQFDEEPSVEIPAADALRLMIREGDFVRIYNARGEVKVKARYNFSLRRGCLIVCNGWWISEGGGVNFLTAGRETDMGYGAAFHDNRVNVEPAAD